MLLNYLLFLQLLCNLNFHSRYPTFIDALRDLDDCLTLCFMFAALPRRKTIPSYLIAMCRRLTLEFMHAVIASRALRHVFVSIKGIYYQVEFRGQIITWLVSHSFGFDVCFSHLILCNNYTELIENILNEFLHYSLEMRLKSIFVP